MIRLILICVSALVFGACNSDESAQEVIDHAIKYSGNDKFEKHLVSFDFRKYKLQVAPGEKHDVYTRIYEDTTGKIRSVYDGNDLMHYRNDTLISLPEKRKNSIISSINSQVYFVQLPSRLNDSAVKKSLLGKQKIGNKTYNRIKVTFTEEGGGEDYEDVYVYWFDTEDYSMDYLAYSFKVNGGGIRLRKAFNERKIGNMVFQDYHNYGTIDGHVVLEELPLILEEGRLKKLSEIKTENPQVTPL